MDKKGHIGLFSTFNRAYIPPCVLQSRELYLELANSINSLIVYTKAIKVISEKIADGTDFEEYTKKGLFTFDYYDIHRSKMLDQYDMLFRPEIPLIVDSFSSLKKYETIIPVFELEFSGNISFDELKEKQR